MKLNELLGYGTIKTKIKVQDLDTKEIIFEGFNGNSKQRADFNENYKVGYFKIEKNTLLVEVFKEE